jgi:tryptophanase
MQPILSEKMIISKTNISHYIDLDVMDITEDIEHAQKSFLDKPGYMTNIIYELMDSPYTDIHIECHEHGTICNKFTRYGGIHSTEMDYPLLDLLTYVFNSYAYEYMSEKLLSLKLVKTFNDEGVITFTTVSGRKHSVYFNIPIFVMGHSSLISV